jgi:ABC-type branched-subunit amino acid transport system permease subunit
MTVVGGAGSLTGGVVGAATLTGITQVLNYLSTQPGMPYDAPAVLNYAGYSATLILAVLLLPTGLVPRLQAFRWKALSWPGLRRRS